MEKATREKLAKIAKDMAQVPFHGDVDGMASNLIWRRFRFTEMLMGWLPILRRLCDCFRHGISGKLTGYGVRRLSIIAARQRDSKSRSDLRSVKPVIWLDALAGKSLL